jgi:RNA-binding protein 39
MKFVDVPSAAKAVSGLNGRFFGGRSLQAAFIGEAFYKAHAT